MPLSPAQQAIAADDKRFRVAVCGRRFGKTFLSIREMARFARYPGKKIVYIAPSYRQAKSIVWEDLKTRIIGINWHTKINESELSIVLKNGSKIMLRSADNYDSMRGLGLDFVVFDEFADMAPEVWSSVIRPALSDRQGHALFIGTPRGFSNWSKDLFDQGIDPDFPDWSSYSYTSIEGGNIPPEEIEAARVDLDARTFREEYEATFEQYKNNIYYSFNKSLHSTSTESVQPKEKILLGCDFNVNPLAAVIGVMRPNGIHITEDLEIYGSNTYELVQEVKNRYPDNPIIAFPDASGGNSNTKGISDHRILQNAGFTLKAPRANPPVKDRIAAVNSAFQSADGSTKLWLNSRCKRLAECLEKQVYKEETRIPEKGVYDHLTDALGYAVHSIYPIKRDSGGASKNKYWGPL